MEPARRCVSRSANKWAGGGGSVRFCPFTRRRSSIFISIGCSRGSVAAAAARLRRQSKKQLRSRLSEPTAREALSPSNVMRRREFIRLAGTALLWPRGARAADTKRVGVLMNGVADNTVAQGYVRIFAGELGELGWNE